MADVQTDSSWSEFVTDIVIENSMASAEERRHWSADEDARTQRVWKDLIKELVNGVGAWNGAVLSPQLKLDHLQNGPTLTIRSDWPATETLHVEVRQRTSAHPAGIVTRIEKPTQFSKEFSSERVFRAYGGGDVIFIAAHGSKTEISSARALAQQILRPFLGKL